MNPLVPVPSDIVWAVVWLAGAAFTVTAVFSWAHYARHLPTIPAIGWLLGIMFLPPLGAGAWFLVARPHFVSDGGRGL